MLSDESKFNVPQLDQIRLGPINSDLVPFPQILIP